MMQCKNPYSYSKISRCNKYNLSCIFICVCLVLSRSPIKPYSQKQSLLNNSYNSIVCLVLLKLLLEFIYGYELSCNIYNNSMCVISVCLHITNTTCVYLYVFASFSQKPLSNLFAETVITE